MKVLILPGINGSGPRHWQTLWEQSHPEFQRVAEPDWKHPDRREWVQNLEAAVRTSGPATVLVAHSLGCLQVAFWAARSRLRIRGALLVAPPDPKAKKFPKAATGFAKLSMKRMPFVTIVAASSNDPYAAMKFSAACAQAWGGRLVSLGPRGHLNAGSRLGLWPRGFRLLQSLMKKGKSHA